MNHIQISNHSIDVAHIETISHRKIKRSIFKRPQIYAIAVAILITYLDTSNRIGPYYSFDSKLRIYMGSFIGSLVIAEIVVLLLYVLRFRHRSNFETFVSLSSGNQIIHSQHKTESEAISAANDLKKKIEEIASAKKLSPISLVKEIIKDELKDQAIDMIKDNLS